LEKSRQCLSLLLQLYGYKLSFSPSGEVIECLVLVVSFDRNSLKRRALRVIKAAINNGVRIVLGADVVAQLKKSEDSEVAELAKEIWMT